MARHDGESFVDVGVLLNLPGAFALTNEWGRVVFMLTGDGVREFHTMFLPEGRGERRSALLRRAI